MRLRYEMMAAVMCLGALCADAQSTSADATAALENPCATIVIDGHGGRVKSFLFKPLNHELVSWEMPNLQTGGLCRDTTLELGFPGPFADEQYTLQSREDGGQSAVTCTHLATSGDFKGLRVTKEFLLRRASAALQVKIVLTNESDNDIALSYRNHNVLWFDPDHDDILIIPTNRGMMHRIDNADYFIKDIAEPWMAAYDLQRRFGLVCRFRQADVKGVFFWTGTNPAMEIVYTTVLLKPGQVWKSEISYLPFRDINDLPAETHSLKDHLKDILCGGGVWDKMAPMPPSREFSAHTRNYLLAAESQCVVSDEWPITRKRIASAVSWVMCDDLPSPTAPLKPIIHGTIERGGYAIETISAQVWPGLRYSMRVYVPVGAGPFPAVLVVSCESGVHNQERGAAFAKMGILAVDVVPIGKITRGTEEDAYGYNEIAMLAGTSICREQIYLAHRCIDYLCSRKDVDVNRIGITGASDGGGVSLWTAAADSRIKAVAAGCINWTYQKYLLPGEWKFASAAEAAMPAILQDNTNIPTIIAFNAPKWMHIINVSKEQYLFDQIPLLDEAAIKAYTFAGVRERYSASLVDCEHGYWPEVMTDAVTWFCEVFNVNEGHCKERLAIKKAAEGGAIVSRLTIDGNCVAIIKPKTAEYKTLYASGLADDPGKAVFLQIVEQRRKAAIEYIKDNPKNTGQVKAALKKVLGIDTLKENVLCRFENDAIVFETEPHLWVTGKWVNRHNAEKAVEIAVGRRGKKMPMVGAGMCIDLPMREESFLSGEPLDVFVLLGRAPLGMWVWDTMCAARALKKNGIETITVRGMGDEGTVIALYAAVLSDDINAVRIEKGGIASLSHDVVGKSLRDTPLWAYRLLWTADLPQCITMIEQSGKDLVRN